MKQPQGEVELVQVVAGDDVHPARSDGEVADISTTGGEHAVTCGDVSKWVGTEL